jgi:isopentenyl-diphosphate delta-isomerase
VPSGRDVVVLVDASGEVTGSCEKLAAHTSPGRLHLAFSVFLFRDDGTTLLQQRAAVKYHFPLVWANACCSHPAPGEDLLASAEARVREELGLSVGLEHAGSFLYRAPDPVSGRVEHELDHVFVGELPAAAHPHVDPDEVAALCFVAPEELAAGRFAGTLAPWVTSGLELAMKHRSRRPVQ